MNKKEQAKKKKIRQIKDATQKRVKRIEAATGIKINVDYTKLEKSPGRYAKQYEQISLKKFKSSSAKSVKSDIIKSIEGEQLTWEKGSPIRKRITLEKQEAMNNINAIIKDINIKGQARKYNIAPEKTSQTKFKNRKQYKDFLNVKKQNAYNNLLSSMEAAVRKSFSKEDKNKLEKMIEVMKEKGVSVVDKLNKTGIMYKYKVFNFFDSDQEGQVSRSNVDNLELIFKAANLITEEKNEGEKSD